MRDIDSMLSLLIKQDREGLVEKIKESALFDDLLIDYAPLNELQDAEAELTKHENLNKFLLTLSRPLHEAICEGRKDDAIYLLRQMFNQHFNDAETYARLFPGRVK